MWRTTVEVIDAGRHGVVASVDPEGHALDVPGPDRYATFRELESRIPVVTIHRLVLHER